MTNPLPQFIKPTKERIIPKQNGRLKNKKNGILIRLKIKVNGKNHMKYLLDYLMGKLEIQLKDSRQEDYDVNNVIFFIAEKGVDEFDITSGGFSYPDKPLQIIFDTNEAADSFCTHEVLHGHGLAHSFANKEADANALYTFEALKTENIMDYSHLARKECYSLWKWQWEILHQSKNLK